MIFKYIILTVLLFILVKCFHIILQSISYGAWGDVLGISIISIVTSLIILFIIKRRKNENSK
jgi:hypothetical protein